MSLFKVAFLELKGRKVNTHTLFDFYPAFYGDAYSFDLAVFYAKF